MSNKKDVNRLVFVLGGMSNGGAERVVSILANYYAKKGKKIDIITLLSSNCTYPLESNVRIISLANETKSRKLQIVDWIKGIRKYYKEYRPYRVVSFFAKINIIVLFALYRNLGDIVVSERNDPSKDGRSNIVRLLTNILYPFAKKVVFQTNWAKSCFLEKVQRNSIIVPNPVTEIVIGEKIKKEKVIINVGKLMEQKNQRLVIKAFSLIAAEYPEYKLIIYGEGSEREGLEDLISELGLKGRVELPGWTSEIHKRIAESELFVLSSNYEGFSNALLEAMMIGVPCISTDCAGSNELIENNANGLLVPVNGLSELVSGMRLILNNPALANKLAQQGKRDVQKYGVSNIIIRWESVIDR